MACDAEFLAGDNLDAILNILEENEGIEEEFVNEVENKCCKKYKTRGGYQRHQASKHSECSARQVPFDSEVLNQLVNNTVMKLKENEAHSEVSNKNCHRTDLKVLLKMEHLNGIQKMAALRNCMEDIMQL